ncbi:MAG: HepT-like ribonuclease domain-containing protein [archaeon]
MYDLERIGKAVADIEKYLKELEGYKISSISSLEDSKTYNASSMLILAILNRAIDLGADILSAENLGAPATYQDILPMLSKSGFMNKKEADNLNNLIKKRNIFAHYYGDLTEKEVFNTIGEIGQIRLFVDKVKKRVSGS